MLGYEDFKNYGIDCATCEGTLTSWNTEDWGREGGNCDECCERLAERHAERVIEDAREQAQVDWYRNN